MDITPTTEMKKRNSNNKYEMLYIILHSKDPVFPHSQIHNSRNIWCKVSPDTLPGVYTWALFFSSKQCIIMVYFLVGITKTWIAQLKLTLWSLHLGCFLKCTLIVSWNKPRCSTKAKCRRYPCVCHICTNGRLFLAQDVQ